MKRYKDLYFVLFASLILVIAWVVFSIYQRVISSTISKPIAVDIRPIEPTFKEDILVAIKKRQNISPLFSVSKVESSPQPSPSPSTSSTPTPSPSLTPTPSSSSGGEL